MSIFDGIKDAPMPNSGIYFRDGTYLVEVNACRSGMSRKPGEGAYTVVEGTILEVLVEYEGSNQVGERANWIVKMKHGETSLSNIKGFIAAGASSEAGEDIDPEIIDSEMADTVFGNTEEADEEAMAGVRMIAIANTVKTKKDNDFTKVVWLPDYADWREDSEDSEDE